MAPKSKREEEGDETSYISVILVLLKKDTVLYTVAFKFGITRQEAASWKVKAHLLNSQFNPFLGLQRYTGVSVHRDIFCHDMNIVY